MLITSILIPLKRRSTLMGTAMRLRHIRMDTLMTSIMGTTIDWTHRDILVLVERLGGDAAVNRGGMRNRQGFAAHSPA